MICDYILESQCWYEHLICRYSNKEFSNESYYLEAIFKFPTLEMIHYDSWLLRLTNCMT